MLVYTSTHRRRSLPFFSLLIVCCVILSGTAAAVDRGVILCVCPDGHVQLEVDCENSPCDPDEDGDTHQNHAVSSWVTNAPSEHRSCLEIPLIGIGHQLPDESVAVPAYDSALLFVAQNDSSSSLSMEVTDGVHTPTSVFRPLDSAHLRTSVLLI